MRIKNCFRCNVDKDISLFGVVNRNLDGISNICKECKRIRSKLNKSKREPIDFEEGVKECSSCNIEKKTNEFPLNNSCSMGVHSICKICNSSKACEWGKSNPEKMSINGAKYRKNNPEKEIARRKLYYDLNKHVPKKSYPTPPGYSKAYRLKHKDRENKINRERRLTDPIFKFKGVVRCSIRDAFHRCCEGKFVKSKRSEVILGCTMDEFLLHIESQFLSWMSWDNQGTCPSNEYNCTWHLDHILPLFLANTEEEIIELNHWSNFQPLCSKRNREKWHKVAPLSNIELNFNYKKYKTNENN